MWTKRMWAGLGLLLLLTACAGPIPGATPPTPDFGPYIGMGYLLVTTEAVGPIPAGTRVRISYATYSTTGSVVFAVAASDDQTPVEVEARQLAFAPDVTPGPTPTPAFGAYIGLAGYPLLTTEDVGPIPAGSRVRLSASRFDGRSTLYDVVMQDERRAAEARQDQLVLAPDVTPGVPATASPAPG